MRVAAVLAPRKQQRVPIAELALTPLDLEIPAGVARKGIEQIDILAVDQSGRLVVVELKSAGKHSTRSLQHSVFQSLRYWDWVHRNRRALQILYGKKDVRDVHTRPLLLIVNQGAGFPSDVLDVQRAAPTEGTEPLMRMFRVPANGETPVEERPTWKQQGTGEE